MVVVVWVSMRAKVKSGEDYFLSGRNAGWLQIGTSIFTSNIGSEHLVGLAGAGFATGLAMAHWEMQGWIILILGWVFVPIYDRIKIFTMPEYLEKRFFPGSAMIGFWYWCTDQYIVQRVLAGRNQQESRRGSILAGYLKLTPVFIFMVPGMVAFALTTTTSFVTSGDAAYTSLDAQLLPHGIRGVVACGMLTALMASLASKFNASSTLFTMDFYQKWHPAASGRTQVIVGRIATGVIVLIGIMWIPVMKSLGKNLYVYLQSVQGYMSPAIVVLFLTGIFWKRATAPAAFWSFLISAFGGFFRLGLDLLIGRPLADGLVGREVLSAKYGILFTLQQINWLYYSNASNPIAILQTCRLLVQSGFRSPI